MATEPRAWTLPTSQHLCSAKIHQPSWETAEQQRRQYRAARAGREPHECLQRATHVVDGRMLCRSHAGQAALRILMGEPL